MKKFLESAKNRQIGAYGLNRKTLLNSEVIFEIHDKNWGKGIRP